MSERSMTNHLERERLSALLDEPGADPQASAHLETCTACRAEFEHLSRMRMALSGLGDLDAPAGEWSRIVAALERRGLVRGDASNGPGGRLDRRGRESARPTPTLPLRLLGRWPAQAAAAFLLFAGGILAGLQWTEGRTGTDRVAGGAPAALRDGAAATDASSEADAGYLEAMQELQELDRLRSPRVQQAGGLAPASAAERLARLEALIQATREAVREDPADPVANAFLFQLVEEREVVASQLNESLRLVAEYR